MMMEAVVVMSRRVLRRKCLSVPKYRHARFAMVVSVEVRSESSSLLAGRARAQVPSSRASRILVPVVLSVFAVSLVTLSFSASTANSSFELVETDNVGEKVLKAITDVASKSGHLHSEAAALQTTDNIVRHTLAHDKIDAAADEHAIHKFSTDLDVAKPVLVANEVIVARLQASIKSADQEIAVAKKAMDAAEAAEAVDKKEYLKAASPWQKVQSKEASAQKKYRADEQHLKELVKKAAADPSDSVATDRLVALEKKLHDDRKSTRSGSLDIDKLGVLANQETLVVKLGKAQAETTMDTNKYDDLVNQKASFNSRLIAESSKVAREKARIASDQRMLSHFKDLLATIKAQEERETGQKLKVMSMINELVASAPVAADTKAADAKSSAAKK
jgi:hypothetical protein